MPTPASTRREAVPPMLRRSALLLACTMLVPLALAGGLTTTDPAGDESAQMRVARPDGGADYVPIVGCHDPSIDLTGWSIATNATTITFSISVLDAMGDASCLGQPATRASGEFGGIRDYVLSTISLTGAALLARAEANGTIEHCVYVMSVRDCVTTTLADAFPDGHTLSHSFPIQGSAVINGQTQTWDMRGETVQAQAHNQAIATWNAPYASDVDIYDGTAWATFTL